MHKDTNKPNAMQIYLNIAEPGVSEAQPKIGNNPENREDHRRETR